MSKSIKLEEILELTLGPQSPDWEQANDKLYSAVLAHPNYGNLTVNIEQLGTGTAFTLSVTKPDKTVSSWTGDVQPELPEYSGNRFKMIYDQAQRNVERREKTTTHWWS